MKTAARFLIPMVLITIAWSAYCQRNPVWTVVGIIDTPEYQAAIFSEWDIILQRERDHILRVGERDNNIELRGISQKDRTVEAIIDGTKTNLTLMNPGKPVPGIANGIDMSFAGLNAAAEIYGQLSGRTPLIHSSLQKITVSGQFVGTNRNAILTGLEKVLLEVKVTLLTNGEKFVLILPSGSVSNALARLPKVVNATNQNFRPGEIDFPQIPFDQFIDLYGSLIGARDGHVYTDQVRPKDHGAVLTLKTVTSLTTGEACFALETLIAWSGYRVVGDANGVFKAVPISEK